ncbi:unnamed protein product [Nyctereutes procyonoides]|uniref:(raccoon dog) hypothetical protein n=1 Tax=Nyctereutes procyonoides TaxID=34880 RepID=A0A811ZPK4_NYCPR|nr:unnamed protein product [Nyctereutes procyonoides]
MSWKDLSDTFPFPFCHHNPPERKFTNNPQLEARGRGRKRNLHVKNNQVLTFCCQKDLEVLCPQCSFSTLHRNHYIWPIEKAAPHHRKRLQNCIEPWKERIEQVEKVIIMQSRKSLELKKVQCRREEIKSEFEQLLLFLKNEREIEYGYHLPPQYSGLKKIKSFQVDLILDCETAHRKLIISEDRKTVRFYLSPAVLSSTGYNSGKQYWEVEVKDKPEWIMGVCKDSLSRRRKNQNQPVLVQDRLWGVGRCSLSNYIALGPRKINLLPKVIPTKIVINLYIFNYLKETVWPYFYTGTDSKHLKICAVTDSE